MNDVVSVCLLQLFLFLFIMFDRVYLLISCLLEREGKLKYVGNNTLPMESRNGKSNSFRIVIFSNSASFHFILLRLRFFQNSKISYTSCSRL